MIETKKIVGLPLNIYMCIVPRRPPLHKTATNASDIIGMLECLINRYSDEFWSLTVQANIFFKFRLLRALKKAYCIVKVIFLARALH